MIAIGGYVIDANISEEHTLESEVTEFPVEEGGSISDNIRNLPIVVKVESVVTDSPHGSLAVTRAGSTLSPSQEALEHLISIRDNREPVTIDTDLRRYDSMALQTLVIPRDKDTGKALRFSATFKQIDVVVNVRTTVRVLKPSGGRKRSKVTKASTTRAESPMFRRLPDGRDERVRYDVDGGVFTGPDGKTPLTADQVSAWDKELTEEQQTINADAGIKGLTPYQKSLLTLDTPQPSNFVTK